MDSRIADVLVWCIWSSNFEVRNWSNWTDCAADCEFIIAVVDLRWLHATAESSDTGLAKSKRSPDVPGLPKSTSTMYKKNQMGKALEMKKILEKWKAVGNPWAEHYVNTVNVSRCLNLPHFQVAYHLHRRHPPGLLQTSRRSLQGSGIFIGDFLRNLAFCILLSQIVRWFQAVWQIWDFKFSTLRELWASDNVKTKKTILNLRIQSDQTSLRPPNTVLWQRTSRVLRGCDFSPVILDPNGFKISIAQIILSHGFIQWYADMPHGSWNSWYHRKASQHSRENTNRLVWMLMSLSSMSWSCHSIVPELSNPSQILHLNFNVRMSLPWPLHLAMSGKGKTVKGENNQVTRRNFWISQLTWRILLRNVSNVLCKNLRSLLCCVKLGCLWTGFTIIARLTNTLAKETIHNFQWLRCIPSYSLTFSSWLITDHVYAYKCYFPWRLRTSLCILPIVPFIVECHLALSFPHVPFPSLPSSQPVEPSCPSDWKHLENRWSDWLCTPCRAWEHPGHDTEQVGPNQPKLHWQKPWRKAMKNRVSLVTVDSRLASWSHLPRIQLPRGRLRTVVHHLIISSSVSKKLCIRSTSATSSRTLARRVVFLPKWWLSDDVTNVTQYRLFHVFLVASCIDQLANSWQIPCKSHAACHSHLGAGFTALSHTAWPRSKPGPGSKDHQIHKKSFRNLNT